MSLSQRGKFPANAGQSNNSKQLCVHHVWLPLCFICNDIAVTVWKEYNTAQSDEALHLQSYLSVPGRDAKLKRYQDPRQIPHTSTESDDCVPKIVLG